MENSLSPAHLDKQNAEIQKVSTAHSPFTNILIYVDGSETSIEAIKVGIRMASVSGLTVQLLYVIVEQNIDPIATISQNTREVALRQMEVKSRQYLDYGEQLASQYGVKCQNLVRRGIPHDQIIDIARKVGIDLIVIGDGRAYSTHRSISSDLIHHVIEEAPCSVLVVRSSS